MIIGPMTGPDIYRQIQLAKEAQEELRLRYVADKKYIEAYTNVLLARCPHNVDDKGKCVYCEQENVF